MPKGYYVYRSGTYNVFIFLRGFFEDPKNLMPAVAHLERTKIYPLNSEVNAKPMKFPDASGIPVNMLPISNGSAFEQLKPLVDREGENLAGPDWLHRIMRPILGATLNKRESLRLRTYALRPCVAVLPALPLHR